jgi:hypothetical protein
LTGSTTRPDASRRRVALHSVTGRAFQSVARGLKVLPSLDETQAKAEAGGYLFCACAKEW